MPPAAPKQPREGAARPLPSYRKPKGGEDASMAAVVPGRSGSVGIRREPTGSDTPGSMPVRSMSMKGIMAGAFGSAGTMLRSRLRKPRTLSPINGGSVIHVASRSDVSASARAATVNALADAVMAQDCEAVRSLITRGVNPDAGDLDQRTALHVAASEGVLAVAYCLVDDLGASASPIDRWGGTPLDDARRHGHRCMVDYLISKGAQKGQTSLAASINASADFCFAAAQGDIDRLKGLVEDRGLDINLGDYDQRTAIHLAASEGNLQVVRCLVEDLRADVNPVDRWGGTPLDDATRQKNEAVVKYLSAKGAKSGKTAVIQDLASPKPSSQPASPAASLQKPAAESGAVELCQAAASGALEKMRHLAANRDINAADFDCRTALHVAATKGRLDVATCLIEELHADVSPMDRYGNTPLNNAISHGHDSVAAYLKSRGAALGQPQPDAFVDIRNAAALGDLGRLRDLINTTKLDPNSGDYDQRTALHLAATEGLSKVAQCLIEELGADTSPLDRWGNTPMDDAVRMGHQDMIDYLTSKNCSATPRSSVAVAPPASGTSEKRPSVAADGLSLCAAAAEGNLSLVKALVRDGGCNVNQTNVDSRTPLHVAASNGCLETVVCLVRDLGADVEVEDRWGNTPVDDAVGFGHEAVVQYLQKVLEAQAEGLEIPEAEVDPLKKAGTAVFDDRVMTEVLPLEVCQRFKEALVSGAPTSAEDRKVIADAMFAWAREQGVHEFSHWFFPMRGGGGAIGGMVGAMKMDTFLDLDPEAFGKYKQFLPHERLFQGETDGSSFPNGGLRETHAAAAFTTWDRSSPPFIADRVLRVPCSFVTHYGKCIDDKTPLLRSMDAVRREGLRMLAALGAGGGAQDVRSYLGWEQEFFVVPTEHFLKRPDLLNCGRTLIGNLPTRNQQADLNYFGPVPHRVDAMLQEVQAEMLKIGCPMSVRHNEVAPGQHEMSPIFSTASVSCDTNNYFMEVLNQLSVKHGLMTLFHEKPFAGINGSGKHSNWSAGTDQGMNFFYPGKTDESRTVFVTAVACLAHGIWKYNELVRCAVAHAGNDHRLGAQEAPPAIISLYPGVGFEAHVDAIIAGGDLLGYTAEKKMQSTGCNAASAIEANAEDRNRTAPFPFCGNRFEFRAVGSSQNCAFPVMVCNTILAAGMSHLTGLIDGGMSHRDAVAQLYRESRSVIFTGNGYSAEWLAEAKKRGLPNLDTTPKALATFGSSEIKDVLQRMGIFSPEETEARAEVMLENYITTLSLEAKTMLGMLEGGIMPACVKDLRKASPLLRAKTAEKQALYESIAEQTQYLKNMLAPDASEGTALAEAERLCDVVKPRMEILRRLVDQAEGVMAAGLYPFPTYEKLLFSHHH